MTAEKKYDIMVAGHLCLDVIPRFPIQAGKTLDAIITPGKLVNVDDVAISTGGPVSNTGRNIKTLGAEVCFSARVGDDAFGQITVDILQTSGNAEGIRRVSGAGSSYTIVIAPPGIDRVFLHSPATNDSFGHEDLDLDLVAQCRMFHLGYPPLMQRMYADGGEELARVFRTAKEARVTTSCDMALPDPGSPAGKANWRKILEKCLPYIDIFLPSIEETDYMLDPGRFVQAKADHGGKELIDFYAPKDYTRIADELIGMGAKVAALKSGHRGFYLRTAGTAAIDALGTAKPAGPENWAQRELWAPALVVDHLASATGSGDSAIAGFLTAFLKGESIERSLRYATCVGWQNLQELDAVSGILPWDETAAMLEEDRPLIDPKLDATGWRWSEDHQVWMGPEDA